MSDILQEESAGLEWLLHGSDPYRGGARDRTCDGIGARRRFEVEIGIVLDAWIGVGNCIAGSGWSLFGFKGAYQPPESRPVGARRL